MAADVALLAPRKFLLRLLSALQLALHVPFACTEKRLQVWSALVIIIWPVAFPPQGIDGLLFFFLGGFLVGEFMLVIGGVVAGRAGTSGIEGEKIIWRKAVITRTRKPGGFLRLRLRQPGRETSRDCAGGV